MSHPKSASSRRATTLRALALASLISSATACLDHPTSPPPKDGVVRVEILTSGPAAATSRAVGGSAHDAAGIHVGSGSGSGYAAFVVRPGVYSVRASISFTSPPPTRLRLPLHCTWKDGNSKPATVVAGELTVVGFTLDCVPPGGLMVTTNTSGPGAPPTQLTVWVPEAARPQLDEEGNDISDYPGEELAPNGFATIALSAGSHEVELRGLPTHCTVASGTKQRVAVQEDVMTYLDLRIRCQ
jgi:hypothetical protein